MYTYVPYFAGLETLGPLAVRSEGLQPCERRDSLYRTNSQSTKIKQAFYAVIYYARDLRGARLLC